VAVPLHLEVFSAVRGGGAHRNGEVVRCSDETELGRALVATGFGYDPQRRVRQAEVVTRVISRIRDIRRGGAASVDFCSVASGRVDAYFERGMQRWDWAAGALIAQEAGAIVAELDGGPLDDGCILAAPAGLWQPLADLLLEAGADEV
jgi:myo-inositol-1(or 4)-monophosphatase